MRLGIVSDIHTDHWWDGINTAAKTECDVLVVAGDLGTPMTLVGTLRVLAYSKAKEVIYVLGNHDFVYDTREHVLEICSEMEKIYPHVRLLENRSVTIGGKQFHGGTLWYQAPPSNNFFDFEYIPKLRNWYMKASQDTLDYLLESVNPGDIVITHHMPTYMSVHPAFHGANSNKYFVCHQAEPIIEATIPGIWIHGHTHCEFDYMLHKTRVICNPCGYPGENPDWKMKVIDV